ncbi:N-acetylneuraminate synthase family protein [Methanobrevibacter sp.]|uniref:N-acetylneuraminate synthase family protein n=1 Tax=Methanobrevibacter sp. TaxID=66852 RepID=UPI0026E01985|nr:N-acetylneuraminate synthase family protein [Methanobrevibacter sp.]MDO5859717.1 N-acetylneuraminate synthase family protein [Methanobrevibacter sp.]
MNIFDKKPYLIANLGFNFIDIAKKEDISVIDAAKLMIDEAKSCGIDSVMFQLDCLEDSQFDEFGVDEYIILFDYCNRVGIKFLAEPFDFDSADYFDEFVDVYKISSCDLTNTPFIKHVASKNKPILLFTGASTLKEIKVAVNAIEDVSTVDIAIFHSVLSYPVDYRDTNLLMIKDLANHFPDYEIGYADHSKVDENMLILTTAVNYGASIIEKYFTLDKTLTSGNHCHSMDPDDVIKFKNNLNTLSTINGFLNKQPLICESSARKEFRKSIVAKVDITKGDVISESDIEFKRPGTGIYPSQIDDIIGKTATRNVSKGTLIDFEMLMD